MKKPKLDDLQDEPSPFQNRDARNQKQHNWDALRKYSVSVGDFLSTAVDEVNGAVNDASGRMDNVESRYNDQIAKATDLNEVIDARRPAGSDTAFATIGARMDDMPNKSEIGDLPSVTISVDGGVKPPFSDALYQFKNEINANQSVVKIGLIQDLHFQRAIYQDEYGEATNQGLVHIQHMGVLTDKLNAVVFNGDNVHGREPKATTTNRIHQIQSTSDITFGDMPVLWGIGNHDDNDVYFSGQAKVDNTLSLAELQEAFGIEKTYNYQDFNEQRLRIITVNAFENPEIYNADGTVKYPRSYNSVFSQNQLFWLANSALKVPEGFSVLIFMHCPPLGFDGNMPYDKYQDINHDVFLNILQAFINGSKYSGNGVSMDYPASIEADFTSQGTGKLVGIISGHEHHDLEPQIINGIRVIERTCNICSGADRVIGDLSEDAFDVIEVDTTKSHCKFNRFGSGNSIEFDY